VGSQEGIVGESKRNRRGIEKSTARQKKKVSWKAGERQGVWENAVEKQLKMNSRRKKRKTTPPTGEGSCERLEIGRRESGQMRGQRIQCGAPETVGGSYALCKTERRQKERA